MSTASPPDPSTPPGPAGGDPTLLQMQRAIELAGERIALVTQGIGIGTWVLDLASGCSHWDAQMWLLRGREPQAQAPAVDTMLDWLHTDDREAMDRHMRDPGPGAYAPPYEFRVVWPDGSVHWLATRSAVVRDEHGLALQRIGANWDVTDARQAAADRQDRALALRESQAKSELLARLSLELRTPLNAILGFTRLLIDDQDAPSERKRQTRLQHIESAGQHLLSLINDVLDLAQTDTPDRLLALGPVALLPLLAETLPMVEAQAAARGLSWQVEVPALAVLADPVRLKQVLLNLLTNAIKYNRDGGQIQIRAAVIGGRVLLRVRDSGIGIAPDRIVDAFEPFQRLRPHPPGVEGVGIGLAIVKTLMQRMGGSVSARSEPGVGSEFELMLQPAELSAPAAERLAELARTEAQQASLSPPPPERGSTGQPRVLYIEDNPVNMMIVAELVARRGGLSFVGAHDGQTGIEAARRERPALILLDMHLPDGHGHQIMARLRADPLTRAIPCVALSANALPADIEAALQLGFSDYWTKPLDFKAFLQALDALFGRPDAGP